MCIILHEERTLTIKLCSQNFGCVYTGPVYSAHLNTSKTKFRSKYSPLLQGRRQTNQSPKLIMITEKKTNIIDNDKFLNDLITYFCLLFYFNLIDIS